MSYPAKVEETKISLNSICIALNITAEKALFIFVIQLYGTNLAEKTYMYISFMALSLQRIRYDLFMQC